MPVKKTVTVEVPAMEADFPDFSRMTTGRSRNKTQSPTPVASDLGGSVQLEIDLYH